jgi:25S rRNA (cytosine2278-C5)-methyltransferase
MGGGFQPRWVRVNTVKTSVGEELARNPFSDYTEVHSLAELRCDQENNGVATAGGGATKAFFRDPNIPALLATNASSSQLTASSSYSTGRIILQDKASCFPAHLLLNSKPKFLVPGGGRRECRSGDDGTDDGVADILDACAAPGNKTSHIFAILTARARWPKSAHRIFACERDATRSETLRKMLVHAGGGAGSHVFDVLVKQDFLALDPLDPRFCRVTHILLDPSCSGSGMMSRQDVPVLVLPKDPRAARPNDNSRHKLNGGLKREAVGDEDTRESEHDARKGGFALSKKRKRKPAADPHLSSHNTSADRDVPTSLASDSSPNDRLEKLSNLQTHLLTHAFSFPHATQITYSTCSIYVLENELVALRALDHTTARTRGWRLLTREEQAKGLSEWTTRGAEVHGEDESWAKMSGDERAEFREACVRCKAGGQDGTMGFFVVGFVRDPMGAKLKVEEKEEEEEEEWMGLSDRDSPLAEGESVLLRSR